MQLDVQSVEKAAFSTFALAFAPKKLELGLARLGMSRSFLQDLSRAISRISRGPVAGNRRQHFFDPSGSNTITVCLLYTSPSPRDATLSRMPSSA